MAVVEAHIIQLLHLVVQEVAVVVVIATIQVVQELAVKDMQVQHQQIINQVVVVVQVAQEL